MRKRNQSLKLQWPGGGGGGAEKTRPPQQQVAQNNSDSPQPETAEGPSGRVPAVLAYRGYGICGGPRTIEDGQKRIFPNQGSRDVSPKPSWPRRVQDSISNGGRLIPAQPRRVRLRRYFLFSSPSRQRCCNGHAERGPSPLMAKGRGWPNWTSVPARRGKVRRLRILEPAVSRARRRVGSLRPLGTKKAWVSSSRPKFQITGLPCAIACFSWLSARLMSFVTVGCCYI